MNAFHSCPLTISERTLTCLCCEDKNGLMKRNEERESREDAGRVEREREGVGKLFSASIWQGQ